MNNNIAKTISQIKKFNQRFSSKKNRLIAYNSVFSSKYLFLNHFSTFEDFYDSPYREIILNYYVNAEKNYPGSSFLLSNLLVEKFLKIDYKKIEYVEKNKENLKNYFLQSLDEEIVDNFLNIIDFSGPDAILNCNLTKNQEFSVEKINYPCFSAKIHEEFDQVFFKNQKSSTKNYLTCLYDGYIERESELYSLIEKSKSNNNCPIVLACRGISHYAVSALKQILLKNNIRLYPYILKFDNSDPFLFEDITKSLDLKSFNIESGDSLYKSLAENSDFRKIKVFQDKIQIFSKNESFLNEINNQIKSTNDPDVLKYLYKRKNRCSPNNVYINIPYSEIKNLNNYKSMIVSYNKIAMKGFYKINNKLYPVLEYNNCVKLSNKLYDTINNIGYTVKEGNKNASKEKVKRY